MSRAEERPQGEKQLELKYARQQISPQRELLM